MVITFAINSLPPLSALLGAAPSCAAPITPRRAVGLTLVGGGALRGPRPVGQDRALPVGVCLKVTARDRDVCRFLRRFGVASVSLLAEQFFAGSVPAARERLRRLARGGYVERLPTDRDGGYRLRDKGLRLVCHDGRRAGVVRWRRGSATVLHTMLAAELAAYHLGRRPPGGGEVRWYSEQELRDGVPWLPLPHRQGWFRLPDGVLEVVTPTGEVARCAIEVERTGKAPEQYPEKLRWYAGHLAVGTFQQVRWFVTEDVAAVVHRAIGAAGTRGTPVELMRVLPIPAGVRVY